MEKINVPAVETTARTTENKRRWLNPEYRTKMLEVFCRKGLTRSIEQRQKMSAAKKGKRLSLNHKLAIRQGWVNKYLNTKN